MFPFSFSIISSLFSITRFGFSTSHEHRPWFNCPHYTDSNHFHSFFCLFHLSCHDAHELCSQTQKEYGVLYLSLLDGVVVKNKVYFELLTICVNMLIALWWIITDQPAHLFWSEIEQLLLPLKNMVIWPSYRFTST